MTCPSRVGVLLALLLAASVPAAVEWESSEDCIWVMDYTEESPATIDDLVQADRENGWGKVAYDAETDTCTVNANLWIGLNEGLGTFFQLGRIDHPREVLRVQGNVWIRAPRLSLKRPDGRYSVVNRLRLGHPDHPEIHATLKIVCEKRGQYHLMVGDDRKHACRGSLHVYNSTITADRPDRDHLIGRQAWAPSDVRFVRATMSWIDRHFMYNTQAHNSLLDASTFEHGGTVLQNGTQFARGCTFRNVEIAVAEGGCLRATMIRCTFEDNDYNWTLGSVCSGDIDLIDCHVSEQKEPYRIRRNNISAERIARSRGKAIVYPSCTEWISLPIKVVGDGQRPLNGALVNVECEEDAQALRNPVAVTDEQGLTSGDPENGAILIVRKRIRATDTPDQPDILTYSYKLTIEASGHQRKSIHLLGSQGIPRPLTVRVGKK